MAPPPHSLRSTLEFTNTSDRERASIKRKVLVVTGDFVPVSSNNTFRALGFAEELPTLGWEPIILTKTPGPGVTEDGSLISDSSTYRVQGSSLAWSAIKRFPYLFPLTVKQDKGRSWIPKATIVGAAIVYRNRIPIIFGSFQPWSALVTAYLISRSTGRPLVIELRDPLISVQRGPGRDLRRLELAGRILKHAYAIIATTDEIAVDIQGLTNGELRCEPVVLPHGFREVDLRARLVPDVNGHFTITFAGSLYNHPCIATICAAIGRIRVRNPELRDKIRFLVIGSQKEGARDQLTESAIVNGIEDALRFIPWQTQDNLRLLQDESHVLWCSDFDDSGKGSIVPGKLTKIVASGIPVMAFCVPYGATWRIVNETNAGIALDYDDVGSAVGFLESVFNGAKNGANFGLRNEEVVANYSFKQLTRQLSGVFNDAINKANY